jgi:hypothetical protein
LTLDDETACRPDVEKIGRAEEAIQIMDPQIGEIGHRKKANVDAEQHKARFGQRIGDAALLGRAHRGAYQFGHAGPVAPSPAHAPQAIDRSELKKS